MHGVGLLDFLPIWALFLCNLALVAVAVEIGYRVGKFRHRRHKDEKETPVGGMVGATLGLLAFLLAFVFGFAASRFDARRQTLLEEANAIGTAYLRTDFLPDPQRAESRKLLREYVTVRIITKHSDVHADIRRSLEIHTLLWTQATTAGKSNEGSIMIGLYVEALNNMIDLHAQRVMVGLRSRIPAAMWAVLYVVAILALATMGYHSGLTETHRSLAVGAVAFTFSAVMWLIAELDRPREGLLRADQQVMIDQRASMMEETDR